MPTMSAIAGYYTLAEAAEKIGVSHAQVSRYVKQGRLPAISIGQQKLIEQRAVHEFKRPPLGNPAFRNQKRTG